jgi:hypothetical protein
MAFLFVCRNLIVLKITLHPFFSGAKTPVREVKTKF